MNSDFEDMFSAEEIWKAQEEEYKKMMEEDDQYCHDTSFRWGFESGVDWAMRRLNLYLRNTIKKERK